MPLLSESLLAVSEWYHGCLELCWRQAENLELFVESMVSNTSLACTTTQQHLQPSCPCLANGLSPCFLCIYRTCSLEQLALYPCRPGLEDTPTFACLFANLSSLICSAGTTAPPRALSYNPVENAVLVGSDSEGGTYDLYIVPKDSARSADASVVPHPPPSLNSTPSLFSKQATAAVAPP